MKREGHTALVHTAAASNLGQMLNRICLQDGIALVHIVRKPEQAALLRREGASHVCDSSQPDFEARLTEALVDTGATLAFDATGGGTLAGQILACMEAALLRKATEYSRYGSPVHKQVYLYGMLDPGPTTLRRNFGMAWGMGGWLLFPFLQKIGRRKLVPYYDRGEIDERVRLGKGPVTPDGDMGEEKYRLVVEGPPNWTHFRDFWKMFYDEGAVVVSSTYAKVGGLYDFGFRHDARRPLESLADYCLGCYTNLNLPSRIDMICRYIDEYQADGLLINSIKSCNSFSAGQLLILREVEKRTGKPAAFIETDLVDPRYFSAANIKNRLESYFQMIEQKRAGGAA